MPHPTLDEWLTALRSLGHSYGVEPDNYTLKSPTFRLGSWRAGVEHQRSFESIVVRWTGSDGEMPTPPERWLVCPRSDQEKGWLYRVLVRPYQLSIFLNELRAGPPDMSVVTQLLEKRVAHALADSTEKRQARIAAHGAQPKRIFVTAVVFDRNPDVVAEVLIRARGFCESCRKPAPFIRRSDETPYLEVHHVVRLAVGGEDTVENAKALCPNCHRREHYA